MINGVNEPNGAVVDPPLECTWDEAIARYYGEWVLFQILEFNEHWEPVRGLVWAHSPEHEGIFPVLATRPKRTKEEPYQPYYPFFAKPRVHVGETLEQARTRFARQRAEALSTAGTDRS
jgi:hypothetical protein